MHSAECRYCHEKFLAEKRGDANELRNQHVAEVHSIEHEMTRFRNDNV